MGGLVEMVDRLRAKLGKNAALNGRSIFHIQNLAFVSNAAS